MKEIQIHHCPGLLLRKERKIIHKPPSPPCTGKEKEKEKENKKSKEIRKERGKRLIPASG